MSKKKLSNLFYILPAFLSLAFVAGCYFWLRAGAPAQVLFTADTIINLEGIVEGDLYVSANSECSSFEVSGKNLFVNSIPEGSAFVLKTTKHSKALEIAPAVGSIELDFSSDNFIAGEIASWTISDSGAPARADIVWGVPQANTGYTIKVNGETFISSFSNASSELVFSYNVSSSSTFTLETGGGGAAFIPPQKPDISKVIISSSMGNLVVGNLPQAVAYMAVSLSPDFRNASWKAIEEEKETGGDYEIGDTLYIKFRSRQGGVSDVITCILRNPQTGEGDIVKTADNFDVYIIKYKGGKQFKRLILSPRVFESYQHLKWENIEVISQKEMDSYATSALAKETNDSVIYELYPDGDAGRKKALDASEDYDPDSVYEINDVDLNSYGPME